ncbi:MAG: hypothetical protein OXE78_05570 [Gammaproteobacteria bacterium]|nr:hypothetical protein [Gammaproteobacteria bacterium]
MWGCGVLVYSRCGSWRKLGGFKGYALSNGCYTDVHGKLKMLSTNELRQNDCQLLSAPEPMSAMVSPPANPGQSSQHPREVR